MSTEAENNHEEVLEYESDDDDFEAQYVESQMGHGVYDAVGNNEDYFHDEFDDGKVYDDEAADLGHVDAVGDEYQENYNEKEEGEEEGHDVNTGEDYTIVHLDADGDADETGGDEADNQEDELDESNDQEVEGVEEDNYDETSGNDDYSSLSKLQAIDHEIEDPFDDDELIEYVDDPNDDDGWGLDDEFKNPQESQANNTIDFPIYLDFCELFTLTSTEQSLEGKWLDDEIKVDFDFMKLYQPECKEDEMYSEIDTLYDNMNECIDLTFNEILFKIKDIVIQNCQFEIDEIDIHLTFGDLMNLSISSDSILSESLTLREVLKIYENLKSQSPNADLYKFLSIKVSVGRSILGQLRILERASSNGYRLENLNEIVSNKRSYEEINNGGGEIDEFDEEGEEQDHKRPKLE